jgi:hypothetical protein
LRTVQLKYNPFIPRLSILIDDRPISDYSALAQYTDEDILCWKENIINDIYSEIREEFRIVFIGRKFDADIIKAICTNSKYCLGFIYKEAINSESVQKRLVRLNKYLKNNNVRLFKRTTITSLFVIDDFSRAYKDAIESIDINNQFCSVKIATMQGISNQISKDYDYIFVISNNYSNGIQTVNQLHFNNPIFIIIIGEKSGFQSSNNNVFIYSSNDDDLLNSIFNCFLDYPLLLPIRYCVDSLSEKDKINVEIQKVYSIDPIISLSVNTTVEVGRSNKISISYEPNVADAPEITFKSLNNDIVFSDGRYIYGKCVGKTLLEAYLLGESKPFKTLEVEAIKRNRIKKIILDEDNITLGEGASLKLTYDVVPANADNISNIKWKSSDETVVSVSSDGTIKCKKRGTCRIICMAENISAQCICTVKPYVQSIVIEAPKIEANSLSIYAMEELTLKVKTIPDDCIDGNLRISSSNCDIVNYVNGKIIGKNKGTAILTISNQTKSKVLDVHISVKKKNGISSLFKRK